MMMMMMIGKVVTEDMVLHLLQTKYVPTALCGLEVQQEEQT